MEIRLLQHGSKDYDEMIDMRIKYLLEPIGVPASYINKEKEKEDILIGTFDEGEMVGGCVLTAKENGLVQLRQMVVKEKMRGKNIGAAIVEFAEKVAKEKGFKTLMMHARSVVKDFYLKSGYAIVGDEFEEVGIKHFVMQKELR
jgi:predicted GNAT family N-acyltransferase